MTELERAFVLAGGLSVERDVSLRSGRRVADALRAVGVEAVLLDADAQLLPRLTAETPDAVFIALHGGPGEDGALRGVLDLMGVAYAGTLGSRVPAGLRQADRQVADRRRRDEDPALAGPPTRHVPRARCIDGDRADRRAARPAADGQAGGRRFGARGDDRP